MSFIDRIKDWFYAIPIVKRARDLQSKIHAWNRWVGYLFNWVVAHFVGAALIASPFLLLAFSPMPFWESAVVGAVVAWLLYAAGELHGWLKGGTSPWWDHVGDMVGPTILLLLVIRQAV